VGMAEEGWKPLDYCAGLVVAMEARSAIAMTHLMKREEGVVDASSGVQFVFEKY